MSEVQSNTFIDRLHEERLELLAKIKKLKAFMEGEVYPTLDARARQLLETQHHAMSVYGNILELRIVLALETSLANVKETPAE